MGSKRNRLKKGGSLQTARTQGNGGEGTQKGRARGVDMGMQTEPRESEEGRG